jgi:hypothetical protein
MGTFVETDYSRSREGMSIFHVNDATERQFVPNYLFHGGGHRSGRLAAAYDERSIEGCEWKLDRWPY